MMVNLDSQFLIESEKNIEYLINNTFIKLMNRLIYLASDCGKIEPFIQSLSKYFKVEVLDANYKLIVNELLNK